MQHQRRRNTQLRASLPFQGIAKDVSTSQGRYTLYALVICATIGMALNQILPKVMSRDSATLTAFGISAVILIACLLKMQSITAYMEKRRAETFHRRLQARKESGADG
jgi:hypothetical protein